jgi:hypothetical protein
MDAAFQRMQDVRGLVTTSTHDVHEPCTPPAKSTEKLLE